MKLSLIVPIYNEEKNISLLFEKIHKTLFAHEYEIISVNDGSRDGSWDILTKYAGGDTKIKIINFSTNYGQTAALSAGIMAATGEIIIPLDSDLENDPADIPKLLAKLEEGYDVVSGWRQKRWTDQALMRKLPSQFANALISRISGLTLHDYGCTLKAYRREVIQDVHLYGEMHRFIPAYAYWMRARVTELPISYTPRIHGKSNYGIGRTFRVVLDLLLLRFLTKYMNRPIHFFGGIGFISFALGTFAGTWAFINKFVYGKSFVSTPLPVFSALFVIVGVQLIVMGIIAEMLMRTYYESQGKRPYQIKETINI